jgi:branched-chain amino acid transport system substrate-binding protein
MSEERVAAADGSAIQAAAATDATAGLGTDTGVLAPGTTGTGVVAPGAIGAGTGTTASAAKTAATATGTTGTGTTATGPAAKTTTTTAAGGAAVATGANAACTQRLAPIVLGQTAAVSGLIGASVGNIRSGMALWLRAINARGGVQCHPIQLYQMDDGADPARVTSNLTDLVDNKKAVAIVGASIPTTTTTGKQFAEKRKIPFIGGDLAETTWYSSPYMFPQGGSALSIFAAAQKAAGLAYSGKTTGLIYCVEAAVCGSINKYFEDFSRAAGLEVVAKKVSSLTSPDYTAECQAMKQAKADVIFFALDGSGDSRAARSCRALGITAPIATSALGVSDATANDPNLRALGVYLGNGNAPFTVSDTIGGKEFRDAFAKYAPGSPIDQNTMTGWACGKLFEAALAKVFDKARSGPVTTELILDGLWQLKGEKLDGIAPPLSFNRNALPTSNDCAFLLGIKEQGYFAPIGSRAECFKGLPRGF